MPETLSRGKAVAMNVTFAQLQLVPNTSVPYSKLIPEQNINDRRVKKVILLMKKDVAQPITLASLAIIAEISPRQLSRLFKAETDYSPMQYLHLMRLEEACFLLGSSWLPAKEICLEVGWKDQSNFIHEFRKQKGCTPCEFREKMMAMKNRVHFYQLMSIFTN